MISVVFMTIIISLTFTDYCTCTCVYNIIILYIYATYGVVFYITFIMFITMKSTFVLFSISFAQIANGKS